MITIPNFGYFCLTTRMHILMTNQDIQEPIGRIMNDISRMFLANLRERLQHLDIERSFYPLLLIEAGQGDLIQQDLARKLDCDKVQIVRIVDYLSSKGYVKRCHNSDDRRKSTLTITEKARHCIPDIQKAIQESTALALQDVSVKRAEELMILLKKIEQNLRYQKTKEKA
jgi:DNA-binding MarR family transcriptional regulator